MTKLSPIDSAAALDLLTDGRWLLRRVMNVPPEYRSARTKRAYRETAWSRIAQANAQLPLDNRLVTSGISLPEVSISLDRDTEELMMSIKDDPTCFVCVPLSDLLFEAGADDCVVTVLYRCGCTLQRLCQVIREGACEHVPQTSKELAQERRSANIVEHEARAEQARVRRNATQPAREAQRVQREQARRQTISDRHEAAREYLRETFGVGGGASIAKVEPVIDTLDTHNTPIVGICLTTTDGTAIWIRPGDRPGQIVVNGLTLGAFSSI